VKSVTISAYKRCSVRLYLQLFVGGLVSSLRLLCLFVHSGVQHLLCCVFVMLVVVLRLLCCQFFWILSICDCPSVFSNVYLLYTCSWFSLDVL
jgi:hypothetical protein